MPRKHPFKRPMRGSYVLQVPAVFTRKDVLSEKWPETKQQMLKSIHDCYEDLFGYAERAIATKH